jgi:transposase-like protein
MSVPCKNCVNGKMPIQTDTRLIEQEETPDGYSQRWVCNQCYYNFMWWESNKALAEWQRPILRRSSSARE